MTVGHAIQPASQEAEKQCAKERVASAGPVKQHGRSCMHKAISYTAFLCSNHLHGLLFW